MFQIACVTALAKRNNNEVAYPEWKYAKCFKGDFTPKKSSVVNIFKEPGFDFTKIPYSQNLSIDGYFQSEKYFKDYDKLIRDKFEPTDEIKNKLLEKYGKILEKEEICSIHVRRGDYLNLPQHHPVMNMNYYMKAVKQIGKKYTYLIFSDDIPWCKQNFPNIENFIFIEGQEDYEDMFLMSFCKNNIICNSSFSWWGAWLNENKTKRIIAPKNWFGPAYAHFVLKDLYCKNWEVI